MGQGQNKGFSMQMAKGSASLLSSHSRGIWPRDVLKKVSRGLSRVEDQGEPCGTPGPRRRGNKAPSAYQGGLEAAN